MICTYSYIRADGLDGIRDDGPPYSVEPRARTRRAAACVEDGRGALEGGARSARGHADRAAAAQARVRPALFLSPLAHGKSHLCTTVYSYMYEYNRQCSLPGEQSTLDLGSTVVFEADTKKLRVKYIMHVVLPSFDEGSPDVLQEVCPALYSL